MRFCAPLLVAGFLISFAFAANAHPPQASAAPTEEGQQRLQIDAKSQPAVNQLAAIAHTIKECPREMTSERQWGKKPTEILRWYVGPPQNVTWDVARSNSIRSPYLGDIEFTLPTDYWVPDESKAKFEHTDEESSVALVKAQTDIHPTKYRYEFDLGPSGLELTRMLRGDAGNWIDDRPDKTCWQNAARSGEPISTSPVASGSAIYERVVRAALPHDLKPRDSVVCIGAYDDKGKLYDLGCNTGLEHDPMVGMYKAAFSENPDKDPHELAITDIVAGSTWRCHFADQDAELTCERINRISSNNR